MFKKTSIAIFVFTLSLPPLWAVTPAQLQQLAGKSTDGTQTSDYAQVYQDAFVHLVEQMDQATGDARYAHQVMLQDICLYASRPGAEKQRLAMSKALADTLKSKIMTPEIRYWVLLQIERTGKAEVLPVLTESLSSTDKIEQGCARAALEKNLAPQATEILLKALAATKDETFAAGLINSLGNRQDPEAVVAIGKQLDHTSRTIAMAAVTALVKINTPDAVTVLKQKLSPAHPAAGAIAKGLLEIAAVSADPEANVIYDDVYAWSNKVKPASNAYSVRKAALIGLARNNSTDIEKMIMADFKAEDLVIKSMAIAAAALTKSSQPAKTMADNSDKLNSDLQNQLIIMLADRNESSVMTPIKHAIKSDNPVLLRTVVDILSQQETGESAAELYKMTHNSNGQISRYAREKLIAAQNIHIDEWLKFRAISCSVNERADAIVLLGERKTPNMTEELFKYAKTENDIVYKAALKAIGLSASPDTIPTLCSMVKSSTVDSFKTSALSAINQILRNSQEKKAAYAIILKEIKAADEDQKVALITTLKMCSDFDAMEYCLDLLSDAEGESFQTPIPQTALEMLSTWSDPMPAKHLLDRARTSEHKLAYAQATVKLARNTMRYDKDQAKKIAEGAKALNMSATINESADKIINYR
ncbi:MAG: HEAT repeat domain-containing protein [Planctomycetota bacterium]|jgi:HEAT repeat protein